MKFDRLTEMTRRIKFQRYVVFKREYNNLNFRRQKLKKINKYQFNKNVEAF